MGVTGDMVLLEGVRGVIGLGELTPDSTPVSCFFFLLSILRCGPHSLVFDFLVISVVHCTPLSKCEQNIVGSAALTIGNFSI